MTITVENDNDVILYAFEKVISFRRRTQQISVAQCVWWLTRVIGLEEGLVIHIDNLRSRELLVVQEESHCPGERNQAYINVPAEIHPERAQQIEIVREVSTTRRDLSEVSRSDQILERAE